MLNILYGWCGSSVDNTKQIQFVTESICNKYSIDCKQQSFSSGGIASFSKYKKTINYSDENYICSIIGHVFINNQNKKQNLDKNFVKNLLDNYKQSGTSFIEQLKGQFILSIIDKRQSSCLIVNDTMATFPVFYNLSSNGQFTFSNHLDLLAHSPLNSFKLNPQAIYNYIYFHMIPSPDTIYQKVFKLEPKQYLFYKEGAYSIENYSPVIFNEKTTRNENQLAKDIFKTLDSSVHDCITDPESTGSFLSGGLDSSAVTGLLAKNSPRKAKSFSIGFPVAEYNEIDYARTAAKKFKTDQYEYFIQPEDVPEILHDVVSSMDEPFGNSSVIPVYYCAKLAKKQGVNYLLAGDGGDEIFAGNTRYSKQKIFEHYFKLPRFLRKKIIEPIADNSLFNSNFFGKKIKSYITQANIPLPARMETYNFLHINSPESVFTKEFLSQINQEKPIQLINTSYNRPDNASSLNRMLYLDWKHTLADNDLRKVNTMCELAGVDVSYPMLSPEMIELSCQIPSKLKLTPYKLRYLYKKAMNGFLPDSIINKPKHGFGLPFGIWTKTDKNLQNIAYSTIDKLKTYNIFNEQFLEDTIKNHKTVHASYYGELIWILMILGLWLENHSKRPK